MGWTAIAAGAAANATGLEPAVPRPVPQAANENDEVLAAKNANKVICCGWLSGVCLAAVQSYALRRIQRKCTQSLLAPLGRQLQRQAIDKPFRTEPLPPPRCWSAT